MLKLEIYLVSPLSKQLQKHTSLSAKNTIFSKVCVPVTQEVLNISQYDFRFWFLTNFFLLVF